MKLYIANGRYVGTQAEAKQIDRGFRPVEVPTSKDELIAYLNQHRELTSRLPAPPVEAATLDTAPAFQSPPPVTPAAAEASAARADRLARDITIEEAIAAADYGRALALAHHIHHRLMEHARAAQS